MITEEEARKKWCPFVRYVPAVIFSFGRIVAAVNRWIDSNDSQENPRMCRCIASERIHWVEIVDGYGYPGCSPFWARMAAKYYQDNEAGKP